MVKPITPADIEKGSPDISQIPEGVIQAYNEMISENYSNGKSSFTAKDLDIRMKSKGIADTTRWLRLSYPFAKDWSFEVDSPGFNENYPTIYIFRAKK